MNNFFNEPRNSWFRRRKQLCIIRYHWGNFHFFGDNLWQSCLIQLWAFNILNKTRNKNVKYEIILCDSTLFSLIQLHSYNIFYCYSIKDSRVFFPFSPWNLCYCYVLSIASAKTGGSIHDGAVHYTFFTGWLVEKELLLLA